jgi:hypothetical protein
MKKTWIIVAGVVVSLFIAGCEQSGSNFEDLGDEVTMAEEEVANLKAAEATDSDVSSARFGGHMLEQGMIIGGSHLFFGNSFPNCATVTVDSDEFPKTITIDYTDGCSGRMGMGKSGTVTIYMSDTILNAGAVYTVTYDNMSMGHRVISKTVTVSNDGTNEDGRWVISFESISSTTFEKRDTEYTIAREFSGERVWLTGFETPEVEDDKFMKSGKGTITVNDVLKYNKTITEPLLIDRTCRYPLSGIVEITRGDETMTIDYGAGECDNIALVTKDGESEEIELNSGKFRKGFQRHQRNMKQNKGWW